MKLATVIYNETQYLAIIENNSANLYVGNKNWSSVLDVVDAGDGALEYLKQTDDLTRVKADNVTFLSPIPRPRSNVMCLGLNYAKHVDESTKIMGREVKPPEFPIVFTKAPSAVNSAYGDIPLDWDVSEKYDWEVELGLIIGKAGKKIQRENAYEHIFGYTIINDVSVRDVQRRHKQFYLGKSFDGCCPIGPVVVTKDELADPLNLRITSRVNGETQQDSNTSNMLFDIPAILGHLSLGRSLEVGDIIATGTPEGVGVAQDPARFLQDGDILESEIESIGIMRNRAVNV